MGGIALDDVSRAELTTAMTQVGCMGRAPCELVPTVPPTSALPPSPSSAPSPDPPSSPWVGSQRLLRLLRRTFDARRLQRAAEPEDLHVTIRFGSIDGDGAEAKPTDKAALEAEVASLLPQETYPDASLTLLVESGAVHVELTLAGRGTPDTVLQAQVQNSSLVHVALSEALGRAVEVAVAVSPYVAPPAAPPSPLPPPLPPPPPRLLYVWPGCADSSATNYAPGDQVNPLFPTVEQSYPKPTLTLVLRVSTVPTLTTRWYTTPRSVGTLMAPVSAACRRVQSTTMQAPRCTTRRLAYMTWRAVWTLPPPTLQATPQAPPRARTRPSTATAAHCPARATMTRWRRRWLTARA